MDQQPEDREGCGRGRRSPRPPALGREPEPEAGRDPGAVPLGDPPRLLEKDPTRAIDRADGPAQLRGQFTVAEIRAILVCAEPIEIRRRFALMVYAGLRWGEAAGLRWGDVDLAGRVVVVQSHGHRIKRGKERIVPLQAELATFLGTAGPSDAVVAPKGLKNDRVAFRELLARRRCAGDQVATLLPAHLRRFDDGDRCARAAAFGVPRPRFGGNHDAIHPTGRSLRSGSCCSGVEAREMAVRVTIAADARISMRSVCQSRSASWRQPQVSIGGSPWLPITWPSKRQTIHAGSPPAFTPTTHRSTSGG